MIHHWLHSVCERASSRRRRGSSSPKVDLFVFATKLRTNYMHKSDVHCAHLWDRFVWKHDVNLCSLPDAFSNRIQKKNQQQFAPRRLSDNDEDDDDDDDTTKNQMRVWQVFFLMRMSSRGKCLERSTFYSASSESDANRGASPLRHPPSHTYERIPTFH